MDGVPDRGLPPLHLVLELARAANAEDPYSFSFAPQAYLLRREGGRYESVHIDWDQSMLAELARVRERSENSDAVQGLGEKLRGFLQPSGWHLYEEEIRQAVQQGRRVMLTLRFAAAELYALPWELVTLKSTGQHIGELPGVLCRYEWPDTRRAPAHATTPWASGRILLAWSAAGGAVPAAEHQQAIADARQAGTIPFDRTGDVLANASCRRLAGTLQAARKDGTPITVLHLLCHGASESRGFGLRLDHEEGEGKVVSAATLRQVLAPFADMVRLIVLCACDSGNTGQLGNHVGSVAQALHRAGFAHVVASRYPLSIAGSVRFAETLYRELFATQLSLEEALLAARQQMIADGLQREWASVQLYACSADGQETSGRSGSRRLEMRRQLPWVAGIGLAGVLGLVFWGIVRPQIEQGRRTALRRELNQIHLAAGEPLPPALCQTRTVETLELLCRAAGLLRADANAALTLLEEAGPSVKESAEYWAFLARARLNAGQPPDMALAAAQGALGRCSTLAVAHNLAGNAEQKAGNLEAAQAAYGKALAQAADYHAPRINLGLVALRRKDPAAAIAALDPLLRSDPGNASGLLVRGQAHLTAGHLPEAVSDLEQTTRKQASNPNAWMLLGTAHARSGNDALAMDAFCRAKALGSTEAGSKCSRP